MQIFSNQGGVNEATAGSEVDVEDENYTAGQVLQMQAHVAYERTSSI